MHKGVGLKMIANNTEPFESIHSGELLWDEHILMGLQSDYDMCYICIVQMFLSQVGAKQ